MTIFLITYGFCGKQWHNDQYFDTRKEALEFLKEEGYVFTNGFLVRKSTGWFPTTRAFVNVVKPYKKKS